MQLGWRVVSLALIQHLLISVYIDLLCNVITNTIQMVWTASAFAKAFGLRYEEEVIVSYLPLSHVAAQMVDLTFPVSFGASVYFARPDALKVCYVN